MAVRVTFIATDLSTGGGVNRVIRDLAAIFHQRFGLDATVVSARSTAPPTYPFPDGVKLEFHPRGSIADYAMVLWGVRKDRPDFVIGSWTQDNILLAAIFLFARTRMILCEHSSWHFHSPLIQALRRLIYPLAWRVLALNPTDLAYYRRFVPGARLMPNPVSPPSTGASPTREKRILAIGHLQRNKNFADAIRAMARSGVERDGWSLDIIGEGPERDRLRALIGELGLFRTRILPPTADLATYYRTASLTLVTARLEVFSLVLAEAMAAGVVPIAYAADGPAYLLTDFPGQLVPVGDVDAMAARMKATAASSDLEPLRASLSASIDRRFSEAAVAEAWGALLR